MKHPNRLGNSSVLLALGALALGLLLLSGCASTNYQTPGAYNYNNTTGYPAVGMNPWHL